ncbi:molybdenum cofactor guanylyltransferase MobA [uncultured Halopseudomonas sp.]|uniref:molybdenum cofactor guanylyltransferase MobA n=1 Tax=uncultured Halopseudomonas sp. TaxID=2901193 RepID=UPI0030EF861E
MASANSFRLSALLLAGGQGRRLGGQDKGLMPWRGKPVAAHLTGILKPLADQVLISCNRNHAVYQQWADQVILDDEPDFPGPLAGILAGLRVCSGTHLLVIPCDMPQVDSNLLEMLIDQASHGPGEVCLLRSGEQWQPLITVIPKVLLPALQTAWNEGQRSPLRWLLGQSHSTLEMPADDARFSNANLPADWTTHG